MHKQGHDCTLDPDPDGYQSDVPPNAAFWKKNHEKWRRFTTISKRNPRTGDYFRSRASLAKERKRHSKYSCVIHPFSRLAKYREIYMFFVWSVMFLIDPIYGTFMMSDFIMHRVDWTHKLFDVIQLVVSVMVFVDIILSFFLGYEASHTNEVVLEPLRIVKKYALTYFFFDLIALINALMPFDLISMNMSANVLVHQLFIFRIIRVSSLSKCLVFLLRVAQVPESIAQCTNIIMSTVYILNWLTCLLAWVLMMGYVFHWDMHDSWTIEAKVMMEDDVSLTHRYMSFLLITMCHFYAASPGPYETGNFYEYLVLSLTIMTGVAYYTYGVAVISQLFSTVNISEIMYIELVNHVTQYACSKRFNQTLKTRLIQYYDAKFQRKFFNENSILYSFSEHLRLEVILYSCKHLIENVSIFNGLSRAAVGTVIGFLKQEIYLPGDVVSATDIPHKDYFHFISYGTVALMLLPKDSRKSEHEIKEIEIMHMEDGDGCGSSSGKKLLGDYRYRVLVLERTEIYSLPQSKYDLCKTKHPELRIKSDQLRDRRRAYIANFIEAKEYTQHEDILHELTRGKIILRGRKR